MGLPATQLTQLEPSMDVASPCTGVCKHQPMTTCVWGATEQRQRLPIGWVYQTAKSNR